MKKILDSYRWYRFFGDMADECLKRILAFMTKLYLNDILKKLDINLERVKLIRHAKSDKEFFKCYEANMIQEYTQCQRKDFSREYDYWIVFVSDKGTTALLEGCYKVLGEQDRNPDLLPAGFPLPEWFNGEGSYFTLEHVDLLSDYEHRLIIDWGKATRSWHQRAIYEKEIIAIQAHQIAEFTGYDNVVLTFNELADIINDSETYSDWHTALSSVSAVYLITDKVSGKHYIGSAYGSGGLLQRWSSYVSTKHGENKKLKELLKQYPDRYREFQFSVLQICSKSVLEDEIIRLESLYKDKLLTRIHGLNDN